MKKYLYALLALPMFLASCDQVDENDRYIEAGEIQVSRKVLLEEFTGQRCVNCPMAHAIIERLEEQYGEDLVVVSIHAGSFGIPSPFGLMQKEGDEYAARWDIVAYPEGVVDRTGTAMSMDSWAAAIRTDIGKDTDIEIDLEAEVSPDQKTIYVTTNLLASENVSGSLQLWVTEDDIHTLQYDGDRSIPDYIHNNVFRGCINGLWGQPVDLEAHKSQKFENSIEVVYDEKYHFSSWDINNLNIVGFVYNDSGVLQVEKIKVVN